MGGRVSLTTDQPHPLRFLALCARPEMDEALQTRLAEEARGVERWDLVVLAAEYHEVVGLLHAHLRSAAVRLPEGPRRNLEGFVARTRHATQTRLRVLAEVLEILVAHGIESLVLKGGALAPTLYREPGHRPLADLDLWVEPERVAEAQTCLLRQGFTAHAAHGLPEHRHLAPISCERDGIRVLVEMHHTLEAGRVERATDLWDRSTWFEVEGQPARSLGPADMLAQLHHHLVYHLIFHRSLRLKWVADLIGVAERFATTIDWAEISKRYPPLPGALAMLHHLSPLSPRLLDRIGSFDDSQVPAGILEELSVLPEPKAAASGRAASDIPRRPAWLSASSSRSLADTFWPAEWRLRLYWGLDRSRATLPYRWRYLWRVIAFSAAIWKSHGGSLTTLSRRPWIRSRLPPQPHRGSPE